MKKQRCQVKNGLSKFLRAAEKEVNNTSWKTAVLIGLKTKKIGLIIAWRMMDS